MQNDSNDSFSVKHDPALGHRTLFPFKNLEAFEIETGVSRDEMSRWAEKGWLSFEPASVEEYDEPQWGEIEFVKPIVRSGLSDEWIDTLLSKLEVPYCYNSKRTFYSFADQSWKTVPITPEPEETVDEHLQGLASAENWRTLSELKETIDSLLEDCPPESGE